MTSYLKIAREERQRLKQLRDRLDDEKLTQAAYAWHLDRMTKRVIDDLERAGRKLESHTTTEQE